MRNPLLTIAVDRSGDHLVVRAAGEIDMGTAPDLAAALSDAVTAAPAPATIVADFTAVGFLGSAGLSVLVTAHHRGQRAGVRLAVVCPRDGLARRAFEISGLDHLLTVADTLDQALQPQDTP
ncbi:STAS domain-containing protein [Actinokineospora iranica]|uniref:Anti-sigma factor antagonist n=1 Tax=Actinokineospora iranica TaxID=1271860 RepID=A0A1G6K1U0_9PSEU|nr:STAS domain-containing protein [Actinokineospora iranica]SDC24595.1 anti-anti-sigma factor [Actinokineospora iranica]